jgi:hypothetical protein
MFDNLFHALQRPLTAFLTGIGGSGMSILGIQVSETPSLDWLGVIGVVMGIVAALLASIVQAFVLWDRWRKWRGRK